MNRAYLKTLFVWFIFSSVYLTYDNLAAQTADAPKNDTVDEVQDDQEQDVEAEQSEEEKAARERARKRREEESKRTNGGTVFKPSEEISEDVPAPFPIDI